MIISLDTECTGLDLAHGAKPFLVTTRCDQGIIRFWEWDVDPLTREPDIHQEDVVEIASLLNEVELIYMQNAKYDVRALATIGTTVPWPKVRDTLVMGHLLGTNLGHRLEQMVLDYLGEDIEHHEIHVKGIVKVARSIAKKEHKDWKIADEDLEGMPSVSRGSKRDDDKPWKNDMWLPRCMVRHTNGRWFGTTRQFIPNPDEWAVACQNYANADSEYTLPLGLEMERLIQERGHWAIYMHRMELPRIACEMEEYGVTARGDYTEATISDYERHIAESEAALVDIASDHNWDLELAEGAALNDNMREFFYGSQRQTCPRCSYRKIIKHWNGEEPSHGAVCPKCIAKKLDPRRMVMVYSQRDNLALPPMHNDKSKGASLDKNILREYMTTIDEGPAQDFIRILVDKRKHDTDLTYMQAYRRFWLPVPGATGYYRIHPSLNPCGTDHLRWASNSPNMQNVSVQEEECDDCDGKGCSTCGRTGKSRLSVRACFGPAPGREWWDLDFKNLEKRIPAYEANDPALIEVFEKPNEPPYWGSDHLLLASLIFPDEFWPIAHIEGEFKRRYLVKYKRTKNTNFAKQYGAGKRKVDATAGVPGAYEKIERGLPELAKLQAYYLNTAERMGFVETLPRRSVDPTRGYPILAKQTESGRLLSTTPFNYHVSGTACDVKNVALIWCAKQCAEWRAEGFDAHIALEVHDSILFDLPRGATPQENLPRVLILKGLMEAAGDDLVPSISTPVSVEYHPETWARGVVV